MNIKEIKAELERRHKELIDRWKVEKSDELVKEILKIEKELKQFKNI